MSLTSNRCFFCFRLVDPDAHVTISDQRFLLGDVIAEFSMCGDCHDNVVYGSAIDVADLVHSAEPDDFFLDMYEVTMPEDEERLGDICVFRRDGSEIARLASNDAWPEDAVLPDPGLLLGFSRSFLWRCLDPKIDAFEGDRWSSKVGPLLAFLTIARECRLSIVESSKAFRVGWDDLEKPLTSAILI